MPELNRSFIKGKMNKDLDERLLPSSEYRDAMNVSVSTSENSDVGAIENLLSTKFIDNVKFLRSLNHRPITNPGSTSQVIGRHEFSHNNLLNKGIIDPAGDRYIYPPAQVVGAKEDTETDRIYYFVKDAASFTQGTVTTSSVTYTFYTGERSDCIFEATPNPINHRLTNQSVLPVLTDVYEVRRRFAAYSSSSTINGASGSGVDYNGIEIGMKVDAIDADGASVWAGTYDNVEVTGIIVDHFQDTLGGVDASSTNHVQITTNKATVLSSTQVGEGVVLVFTKPRILKFESGNDLDNQGELGHSYIDANGDSVLSPTPTKIITAIDVFDGMLFFTDGENEPKKINILNCLKGTISGDNPGGIFNTTHLKIPTSASSTLDNNSWNVDYLVNNSSNSNTPIVEEHITVMRPAPTMPPKLFMSNNPKATLMPGAIADTTDITTGNINLHASGLNPIVGSLTTIPTTAVNGFTVGDNVSVLLTSNEANGIIGTITDLTGNTASDSITISVTSIEGTNANSAAAHNITLVTDESQKLFKDQFARFAYRYRYSDGEVSTLSPFSNPAFLPRAYSYDSKEAFNKGMENDISLLKVQNFVPANIPKDVVGVDILYKEDISQNIYFVRTIKGNIMLTDVDSEFVADGYINETLATSTNYLDGSEWVTPVNKGSITMTSEQFGSTIPSNQILRTWDAVPRKAKAQAISANRVIYANYVQNYNLLTGETNSTGGLVELRPDLDLAIRNVTGFTAGTPNESIKTQRTYQVGIVYKGRLGRETSVLIDKNSSITTSINLSDQHLKLQTSVNSLAPTWATHYKFFIKETSNEYYNLALHKSYNFDGAPTGTDDDSPDISNQFVYLAFQSLDRNKVQEGDYLSIKKARDGGATTYKAVDNKIKVLDIKNEAPTGTSPAISQTEKEGKFFVKVKNISGLLSGTAGELNSSNSPTGNAVSPVTADAAVFEVLPSPDRDVNLYYEASGAYPIELTEETICEWVNPGDEAFGFDYVSGDAQSVALDTEVVSSATDSRAFVDTIAYDHAIQAWGLTFKNEAGSAVDFNFQENSFSGTLHFKQKDGSINISEIFFKPPGIGAYNNGATGESNATVFIKRFTHGTNVDGSLSDNITCNVVLPFMNCYSFGNGVESDRIRDDFNAPRLAKGVKASTTFETYSEETRSSGLIFSGIYNSTSGTNRLNQFIQAEPITKDLNPIYGSIQKLVARDTDIVTMCEDKILKVLANKNALFNADGNTNVTSNNAVLGTAIPFSGEYGVSTNPESVVISGYRVYFTDRFRGAVLRLSNDGLTPISDYGMKDYFKDNLKDATVCIGTYNDRLEEYDLSIHAVTSNDQKLKNVNTISFNDSVNGWSSFRSYTPEQGVSLDGEYYTFKHGNIYEHSLDSIRNSFYGVTTGHAGFAVGATTITVDSPIDPNLKVGNVVIHSTGNNPFDSSGFISDDTIITAINTSTPSITISNATVNNSAVSSGTGVITSFGTFSNSTVTTIFNDAPSSVKSFMYLKYEGSKARIIKPVTKTNNGGNAVSSSTSVTLAEINTAIAVGQAVTLTSTGASLGTVSAISGTSLTLSGSVSIDANASLTFSDGAAQTNLLNRNYVNNFSQDGWFTSSIQTDLQEGKLLEYVDKEGKWFNYIKGDVSNFVNQTIDADASGNIDSKEFSVQGIARCTSSSFAGGTEPGTTFALKVLSANAIDPPGPVNLYTVDQFLISNIQSIANSDDTATGNITFTPTQTPSVDFLTITPVEGAGIAAEQFFILGGSAGTVADAASGTTFTHGTNGITLHNIANTSKPLKSVVFTDNGTPFDSANTVKASIVFADTTLDANLVYEIPFGKTVATTAIETPRYGKNHIVEIIIESYDNSGSAIHPFCISTATVDGAVSSDATVDLDSTPTGNFSVGDAVSGTNVDAGQTVASITDTNTFELSSADTIGDGVTLTFNGVTAGSEYTLSTSNDKFQDSSLGLYRNITTRSTGFPFINVDNVVCSFQISAGTGKKFASSFVNSFSSGVGGFNQIAVSPSDHSSFVVTEQSFSNDGSGNPITLNVSVKFNPPSDFNDSFTRIKLFGKFQGTQNSFIDSI